MTEGAAERALSAGGRRWGVCVSWESVGLAEGLMEREKAVDAKHNQRTSGARWVI